MTEQELNFTGQFWFAAVSDDRLAWQATATVDPLMLEDPNAAAMYGTISRRFASGQPLDAPEVYAELKDVVTPDAWNAMWECTHHFQSLGYLTKAIYEKWQARRQAEVLRQGLEEAEKLVADPTAARLVASRLCAKLLDLYSKDSSGKPQTREELIAEQLHLIDAEAEPGINLPWPRLQDACGPWMPGEVIGLTGFSGSGKSTFTANLAAQLARRGTPVIVFPTEMGRQWLTRTACALCRFPQALAEKGQYKQATPVQRTQLRGMLEDMKEWPWEMVNRSNVTATEIVAAVRTLRRQWAGRPVLVIIDHVHRLDYGSEDADKEAGKVTRLLKNFAADDKDGLVFLCLYQPKKPEGDHVMYQPVYANRIRGHSSVWNELDVHLSIYRTWGERSTYGRTEWGDDAVDLKPDGSPKIAKPFAEDAVLNTEHTFLKPDKRRIGGEGPSLYLNIHKPSGQIFEYAIQRESRFA